jgi:adenine-specific DNA-methyltransferase
MIKYIGSKRALLPAVLAALDDGRGPTTALDAFSGTARVAQALKAQGHAVTANDHNAYAAVLARCYLEADAEVHGDAAAELIAALNALPPRAGWFTQTYCVDSRFFQPHNGEKVDAVREAIAAWGLGPALEAVALTALMEAADRVDSTVGVQMAFLKQWAPRSAQPLTLRVPALLPRAAAGAGRALCLDAVEAVREAKAALVYLDPPYNQHKYLGNYHIWESLVRWDQPAVYGAARKRVDCRERKSAFNSKRTFGPALEAVVEAACAHARLVVLSLSAEGFAGRAAVEALLAPRGALEVRSLAHPRYIGAKIGVYNAKGEKVGAEGARETTEHLFCLRPR